MTGLATFLLAEAAADPMISGNWIIAFLGAGGTLLGVILGHQRGKAAQRITLQNPVPQFDVTTREHPEFVTHGQLNGHLARIEATFEDIKDALDGERGIARTANGNLHKRIDALSEKLGDRLSNLEGTSRGVKETVDKLLDIALGKLKPRNSGQ